MTKRLLAAAVVWCAALPAWADEGGGGFLGLPKLFWSTANLVVFFGLLVYLLARPLTRFFHARREQVTSQMREAVEQQREAERLRSEVEERVTALSGEIEVLKARLRREGEREGGALELQGEEEAARLMAQVGQEVDRRVAEARRELAAEAASVAADLALELLQRELTPEDRDRIFRDTLQRLTARAPGGAR